MKNSDIAKLKIFLVDDESLALKRLSRLLDETMRVEIVGQTTKPLEALQMIPETALDGLFLDIQMPELNGFELLAKLETYPPVVFTTAFDEYALRAFEVYSIDYLLKPVEAERLAKSVAKLEKITGEKSSDEAANVRRMLENLAVNFAHDAKRPLERLPSRIGGRVQMIDAVNITHFFAQDKMTFAQNVEAKKFPVDLSLGELESRLDARKFVRVHRRTIVNTDFIDEVHGWFSGKVLIKLKDIRRTELVIARDRVKILKDFLGM